jgi:hypothetical protein
MRICAGDQPGHEVAEPGGDHQVAVTLDDERWAADRGQALQRAVVGNAPLDERVILGIPKR